MVKAITKAMHGDKIKIIQLARTGIITSFNNNFNPSAKACRIPQNPTTFGPRRRCIVAKTLRSANVKKATPSKTDTIVIRFSSTDFYLFLKKIAAPIIATKSTRAVKTKSVGSYW